MPKIEEVTWILLKILFKLIDMHTSISGSVQTGYTCTHKLLKLTFLSVSALLSVIVATTLSLECCVWRDMNSNEQGCRLKHLFQDLHKLAKSHFISIAKNTKAD